MSVFSYFKKTLPRSTVSCLMHALCISGEENTIEGQISPETALHFLISIPILASSKGEVCTAVKMINHNWRHMYPRLEELLNPQILPSHVMGSDSIHLKKIATPKCLFFWWYWLTYFCLPGGSTSCSCPNVLRPPQMSFQTCLKL